MEQGVGVLYACDLGPPSWLTCSEVDEEEERFEELIDPSTVKLEFFEIPYDTAFPYCETVILLILPTSIFIAKRHRTEPSALVTEAKRGCDFTGVLKLEVAVESLLKDRSGPFSG